MFWVEKKESQQVLWKGVCGESRAIADLPDLCHNCGQFQPLTSQHSVTLTFRDIQVKKVAVEDGLYYSRHHSNLIVEVLCVVAPDPVCKVESAIEAQEEKVVCRDSFSFTCFANHEKLWKDSH